LSGRVDGDGVCDGLRSLPDDVDALPSSFVVSALYPDVVYFAPDALAPLYYYAAVIADAQPGLFVLVNGSRSPAPELRAFIRRILPGGRVRLASTVEKAGRIVDAYRRRTADGDSAAASSAFDGGMPM
jgi:hypothetical protein